MEAFRYGLNVWSIQSKASSITNNLLKRKREEPPVAPHKKRKIVRTVVVQLNRKVR
jgi:hypothetical protein